MRLVWLVERAAPGPPRRCAEGGALDADMMVLTAGYRALPELLSSAPLGRTQVAQVCSQELRQGTCVLKQLVCAADAPVEPVYSSR